MRINSKELFNFLIKKGVKIGREKKTIPSWIYEREEYKIGLLRGLIDTDGSIFLSSKKCILNFSGSNLSQNILTMFQKVLNRNVYVSGKNVNITSLKGIKRYMKLVGSSNLKNVIKFVEYLKSGKTLKSEDVPKFFNKYKKLKLPYKFRGEVS